MEIVWSHLAKITYSEILENLDVYWAKREMKNFVQLTDGLLQKIRKNPKFCPCVNENLGVRKGIIHKNVSLFYRAN